MNPAKYARIERERRYLLAEPPPAGAAGAARRITDRYLTGTRLRLRRVEYGDRVELKLTQKVPAPQPGHVRGLITNTYLSPAEYDLLATLPAAVLTKTRLVLPPLAVDVFDPPLHGLAIAEIEFDDDAAALAFPAPPQAVAEITDDARFAGGRLARTTRAELLAWLAGFAIRP